MATEVKIDKVIPAIKWYDLLRFTENRYKAKAQPGAGDSSLKNDGWSGVSFAESTEMMRNGWKEGTDKINAMLDKVPESEYLAAAWNMEAAGFMPCIPAYLSGDPECMWTPGERENIKPRFALIAQSCYSCSIDADKALRFGAAASAVLRAIEASGADVAVYTIDLVNTNIGRAAQCISVRDFGQPLDVSVVSYAFHTSFLRRTLFANRELNKDWADTGAANHGYGMISTLRLSEVSQLVPDLQGAMPVVLPSLNAMDQKGWLKNDDGLPLMIAEFRKCVDAAKDGKPIEYPLMPWEN